MKHRKIFYTFKKGPSLERCTPLYGDKNNQLNITDMIFSDFCKNFEPYLVLKTVDLVAAVTLCWNSQTFFRLTYDGNCEHFVYTAKNWTKVIRSLVL